MRPLIELPTNVLLDKFGSGKHAPGSGSAAALMGLLAAKLLLTVGALTLRKSAYARQHQEIRAICERLRSDLAPLLLDLFERDAEAFDQVIKARRARDEATDERERRRLGELALDKLKTATDIPFQIGNACLELIDLAVAIFDAGFKGARGDTGAAVSAAVAGAMSSVFVINLNLKSFRGSYWAKQQHIRCEGLERSLTAKHSVSLERLANLRTEEAPTVSPTAEMRSVARFEGRPQDRYSDREIEERVAELHRVIWHDRRRLWDDGVPGDPVELLDPELALGLLGFTCVLEETLGTYHTGESTIEVAGLFEPQYGRVRVSRQFGSTVRMFTAAHELGHAVLHPHMAGAHRDRPLDGTTRSREPAELEADKFASQFLMPKNLLRARFVGIFGAAPFVLTDETAFALARCDLQTARQGFPTLRDLSRNLAGAERFDGRQIVSLGKQFRVSSETMAIRLEELKLVWLDN